MQNYLRTSKIFVIYLGVIHFIIKEIFLTNLYFYAYTLFVKINPNEM
jgi:hypothetical protein